MTSSRAARKGFLLRMAVSLTALSLWVYIPYRYAVRPPRPDGVLGTAYAILFPLAALLALGAILVAWRPDRLERLAGWSRVAVGLYAGAWLLMGLLCIPSLSALAAKAPLRGALATAHMTAQHAFLGLTAVFAAWRPDAIGAVLEGRSVADALESGPGRVTGST